MLSWTQNAEISVQSVKHTQKLHLGKTDIGEKQEPAFDADSLTVNPYLGTDGVQPFVEQCLKFGKSIFALVKTSNKSSGEIQDLSAGGQADI